MVFVQSFSSLKLLGIEAAETLPVLNAQSTALHLQRGLAIS